MSSVRPLILQSNDDGVYAPGLRLLRQALLEIADVITVAPLFEQSANSHSLTLARPLRHREVDGLHAIDGTPADCIYVALFEQRFLPRWPDLVVSGINHGYNLGTDTFYSGTVAAAREGALRGVPAIAFSQGQGGSMETSAKAAAELARRFLASPRDPKGPTPLLNVNFPAGRNEHAGVRATCLGRRLYDDVVVMRHDPRGHEYFWIGGPNARHEEVAGSDTEAVDAGFVSVTPLRLDATLPDHFGLAAFIAGEGELPPTEER
ncbi:5'/3'-nucleotidase SurE [Sandaracinus amylolyticus]|uniref:5'/3'-nucleotidase SurE n=1 Tax=Sandaracinus amylolyticus TaxID=927083 RepID=UPI001F013BCC|nr:5'/3'-nucleotidase SurE [Sandaracinus amylolyticus]UJR79965.1 5'-nucleotidase /3'-nucleotidase /exopolyphosphatase [Sandaracinus amylolyticus]